MSLVYDEPPTSGPLRQGEILADIWEYRPLQAPIEIPEDHRVEVESFLHPLMMVMTAVCDLEWDHRTRFLEGIAGGEREAAVERSHRQTLEHDHPSLVPHVLLCEVYQEESIRHRVSGSDVWKRISQNQDERYHHFQPASVGDPPVQDLPDLYLDFKKTLALPTETLYMGLHAEAVKRVAVVPPIYIHDLMHRFYGFLSRVGTPE